MKFHIFIQGATGSGPNLERGQAAAVMQFEGYFSSGIRPWEANTVLVPARQLLFLCLLLVQAFRSYICQSFSFSLVVFFYI